MVRGRLTANAAINNTRFSFDMCSSKPFAPHLNTHIV
jgi:hypothetical protein